MRLDKFLKVSRIIKRRPVAKKIIDNKKVKIDGKVAKAGNEVREGMDLEIEYFGRRYEIKILEVPGGNVKKEDTKDLYEVIKIEKLVEEEVVGEKGDELFL